MPKKGQILAKEEPGDPNDPLGFAALRNRYVEHLRIRNYSERTVDNRRGYINRFIDWCEERELKRPEQISKQILELYQRHLYNHRDPRTGRKLSFRTQGARLTQLRCFFSWLCKRDLLPANPAADLDLPRPEQRLPKHILNAVEVERVLAQPDASTESGIRDRAMLEVFYSTAIRRSELAALKIHDVDHERRLVSVRQGKGKKDRFVPIGERALAWIVRYAEQVRPAFSCSKSDEALFLSSLGEAFSPMRLTQLVRKYVDAADIGKTGSCHLMRHACATHMMENGADVRLIQEMLGHAKLETTQIYTHVSIRQLQEIHERTHPAAKIGKREKPSEDA
ncbi:MAG TPA: site-specific tyrosine recombinase XerC [Candidatus Krumholzibacteria bacterium]